MVGDSSFVEYLMGSRICWRCWIFGVMVAPIYIDFGFLCLLRVYVSF